MKRNRTFSVILFLTGVLALPVSCGKKPGGLVRFCAVGSETFSYVMDAWDHESQAEGGEPLRFEARGNGAAPLALRNGVCSMGVMSRPMDDAEMDSIVKATGKQPLAIPVAVDALVIIKNKDFPVQSLTMEQAEQLFTSPSPSMAVFGKGKASRAIRLLGLNSSVDTYRWMKEVFLNKKDFSDKVEEIPAPLMLVDDIAADPGAIGYGRLADLTPKTEAMSILSGKERVAPSSATIADRSYPAIRYIYIYVMEDYLHSENHTGRFLRYALSEKAQKILPHYGFFPLTASEMSRFARTLP